jgi:hypothetical protein
MRVLVLAMVVTTAMLVACGHASAPAPSGSTSQTAVSDGSAVAPATAHSPVMSDEPASALDVPAEWLTCKADADCTLYGTKCCCPQTTFVVANQSHLADARGKYAPPSCDRANCPAVGCLAPIAICRDGACAAVFRYAH